MRRSDYQKRASKCCGVKPLIYTRERHQFCHRCCRAYDLETETQLQNWSWRLEPDGNFRATDPDDEYAKRPGRAITKIKELRG